MDYELEEALREAGMVKDGKTIPDRKPFKKGETLADDLAKCEDLARNAAYDTQRDKTGYYEKHTPYKKGGMHNLDDLDNIPVQESVSPGRTHQTELVKDLRAGWQKEKENPSPAVYPGLDREYKYKPGDGCGLKAPDRTLTISQERPLDWHHDEGYDDDRIAAVIIIKRKKDNKHRRIEVMPNVTAVIMNR